MIGSILSIIIMILGVNVTVNTIESSYLKSCTTLPDICKKQGQSYFADLRIASSLIQLPMFGLYGFLTTKFRLTFILSVSIAIMLIAYIFLLQSCEHADGSWTFTISYLFVEILDGCNIIIT